MESRAIVMDFFDKQGLSYARYSLLLTDEVKAALDAVGKLFTAPNLLAESNLTQEGLLRLMNADQKKVEKSLEALRGIEVPYGYKAKHDQLIKLLSKVNYKLGFVTHNLYLTIHPSVLEALKRDLINIQQHTGKLLEKLEKKVVNELLLEGIEI
ncbi:hypothetical protein QYF50_17480 [Paenibacillus vini]|uniref:hypothetical protein n=1 Tax=Paenibacillus vini TaxID=1476024 RepID=UPI0025B62E61|nr:hypothetical protein [Paenibacillus vini]MDN4069697.1 hypothetical protein [Paenibacillus vini]